MHKKSMEAAAHLERVEKVCDGSDSDEDMCDFEPKIMHQQGPRRDATSYAGMIENELAVDHGHHAFAPLLNNNGLKLYHGYQSNI
ncbi:unnamed protein product [Caenorhabditis auriculariae]|uniref:Uncharacterized protein n=1 Tax=Caenorhabditis auriculariae TaxID=2777116 RepID=A0A8S1H0S7_9PELO|nr:unnamed protein product [Caenorhabditis auriculariae]